MSIRIILSNKLHERVVHGVTCRPWCHVLTRRPSRCPSSIVLSIVHCAVYCPLCCSSSIVPSVRSSHVSSIHHMLSVLVAVWCRALCACRPSSADFSDWWFSIIRRINLHIIIFGLQKYSTNLKTSLNRKKRWHGRLRFNEVDCVIIVNMA